MKTIILFALLLFSGSDNNKARVQIVNGYSVFILSRPASSYEYIGSVSIRIPPCAPDSEKLAAILAYVHDSVPAANGIIIPHLNFDTVNIIRFRE